MYITARNIKNTMHIYQNIKYIAYASKHDSY